MLLLCIAVRDNDYPEPVKNPLKIGFGQWYLVVPCWLVAYLYIFFASFFASLRCFCSSSSVLTRHRCVKFHHLLISHLLFFCKGAESRLFLKESQKKAMHTKEVNSFLFPFPSQIFFFFFGDSQIVDFVLRNNFLHAFSVRSSKNNIIGLFRQY